MDNSTFDAVARAVAAGSSRRHVLRLLAIGMVTGLLPGRAGTAAAQQGTECGEGLTFCEASGVCTGLVDDAYNCGACGNVCPSGVCDRGLCVQVGCAEGLADCAGGGVCTSLIDDPNNCGACGTACPSGVCDGGTCTQPGCDEGLTYCEGSGVCTGLVDDAYNCGACGNVCASGVCEGGTCAEVGCAAGHTYCEAFGACYDLTSDPNHCGACDVTCASGDAVALACVDGVCAEPGCVSPLVDCAGECIDLSVDPNNCGACGTVCPGGTCIKGVCTPLACEEGFTYCEGDGACYDLATDPTHCGACDVSCASADGTTVECRSGVCAQTACDAGFANCAGSLECTDLATDPDNCGTCGTVCESGVCSSGVCAEPATPATPAAPTDEVTTAQDVASTGTERPRRDRSSRTRGTEADTAPAVGKPARVKEPKVKSATVTPKSVLAWPFDPEAGQWTIVNGYRGEDEHASPADNRRNYALFALDFAICRPEDVDVADGTCALGPVSASNEANADNPGWDIKATRGANVLSPVDGTVAWTEEANGPCPSVGIDITGHPGYRLALFNVEGHPERGQPVKQGKRMGKVAKGGCEGGDHLHMALYKVQAGAADDPEEGREGVPFTGDWVIDGCDYPDDKRTANQYRGELVPCNLEDDPSRGG